MILSPQLRLRVESKCSWRRLMTQTTLQALHPVCVRALDFRLLPAASNFICMAAARLSQLRPVPSAPGRVTKAFRLGPHCAK